MSSMSLNPALKLTVCKLLINHPSKISIKHNKDNHGKQQHILTIWLVLTQDPKELRSCYHTLTFESPQFLRILFPDKQFAEL